MQVAFGRSMPFGYAPRREDGSLATTTVPEAVSSAQAAPAASRPQEACLNCGTTLAGAYCHACGQNAHLHRTLGAFGHDLLHGVLHFEGKAWRTLPLLLAKPGALTRRYIEGERARFMSPLALFLCSVFLMFATISLIGSPAHLVNDRTGAEISAGMEERLEELDTTLARLQQQRQTQQAAGASTARTDRTIASVTQERRVLANILAASQDGEVTVLQTANATPVRRGDVSSASEIVAPIRIEGDGALATFVEAVTRNLSLLVYKLQTNAYKFSWLLIVLSVPFVALLFLWRWRPLYEHAVFVTYSIATVSLLVIAGSILAALGMPGHWLLTAGMLFIPWHMYTQLRGTYALGRASALWRTGALLVFALTALSLFATGLVMAGMSA
ncbi:DUF3667 domain-containing protein [Qipengyuania thermophila]|uniref:DUF3667 domain-containing protein n=1 Tax=Qipengyuania thermophila TaxID=2509361 RepID=UPI0013ECE9DC|nr:DUF3667 domain-containing protein [Qipengyuania thermophila]